MTVNLIGVLQILTNEEWKTPDKEAFVKIAEKIATTTAAEPDGVESTVSLGSLGTFSIWLAERVRNSGAITGVAEITDQQGNRWSGRVRAEANQDSVYEPIGRKVVGKRGVEFQIEIEREA